ncbi:MAG: hypothetical protein GX640_23365 [Fibrobacter sp.]|nr:hypothetical protein [Fibrobacter sp.]
MSIEYFAYTKDPSGPALKIVKELMRSIGWEIILLDDDTKVYSGDRLIDGIVLGWKIDDNNAAQLRNLKDYKDNEVLLPYYNDDVLGSVEMYVETEYKLSENLNKEEIKELVEDIGKSNVDIMQKSSFFASIRTSSGRNEISHELQYLLAYAICLANGGLFEDEMQGEYYQLEKASVMPSVESLGF